MKPVSTEANSRRSSGETSFHALAVRHIDQIERRGADEILLAGGRAQVGARVQAQNVLLGIVEPDAVRGAA